MHQPARAFPWYLASVGSWFSSFGMQTIVFPWLVTVVLHESPARLGIAQMSLMAPAILFTRLGGAVADRADCRRLLVRGHLLVALRPRCSSCTRRCWPTLLTLAAGPGLMLAR